MITEFAPAPGVPIHPGEMLREDFMEPLGLTAYQIAKRIGVPRTRIERVMRGEMGITADTALRLGKLFGTTPNYWLNLQAIFELSRALSAGPGGFDAIQRLEVA